MTFDVKTSDVVSVGGVKECSVSKNGFMKHCAV